jgi:hypothetical protein
VVYLGFASLGICLHSSHPLFPPLLHLIDWIEQRLLLLTVHVLFVLLHIVEYLLPIIPEFLLQFLHLLLHLTVLTLGNVIDHVEVVLVCGLWVEDSIEGGFGVVLEGLISLSDSLVLSFYFSSHLVDQFSSWYRGL